MVSRAIVRQSEEFIRIDSPVHSQAAKTACNRSVKILQCFSTKPNRCVKQQLLPSQAFVTANIFTNRMKCN